MRERSSSMKLPRLSIKFISIIAVATVLSGCSFLSRDKTASVEEGKRAAPRPAVTTVSAASLAQRPSDISVEVQSRVTRTGEIYLLRGLVNVFSRGMDTLGAKMVAKGLDARVYNHTRWDELARNIIARKRSRRISYPIVIIGHSLGANDAIKMANYLGRNGVKVTYVVGFDPTVTGRVGRNVNRVVNFYLPNDDHSNIYVKARGFRGVVKNVNSSGVRGLRHTTIEKDANYHNQVIKRTLSYTRPVRKSRKKRRR